MTKREAKRAMNKIPFGSQIPEEVLAVMQGVVARQARRYDMSTFQKDRRKEELRRQNGQLTEAIETSWRRGAP